MSVLELDQYIAPDGAVYTFRDDERRFTLSTTGEGMPPIEYLTERGIWQHGESVLDYRLRPRTLQMVYREKACDRETYWRNRGGVGLRRQRALRVLSADTDTDTVNTVEPSQCNVDDRVYLQVESGLTGLSTGFYYVQRAAGLYGVALAVTPGGAKLNITATGTGWLTNVAGIRPLQAGLLDVLRPNRQVGTTTRPGRLRKVLADGSKRDLDVFIAGGPSFEPRQQDRWDEWAYQEVLRFTAYDPTWYDPDAETHSLIQSSAGGLFFPALEPFLFGGVASYTSHLFYYGTWPARPKLQVHGPATHVILRNQCNPYGTMATIERTLDIVVDLADWETLVLDLAPEDRPCTIEPGGRVVVPSADSDLATFCLEPHPTAGYGLNLLTCTVVGVEAGSTGAYITFNTRFIGI